jgi:transcriptional antiterminator RfaH
MCWCVVHVRVGRELAVADLLQRSLHLKVYLPEVTQRWRGRTELGPLFPGYLFVADEARSGALAAIDLTPGCGRLVRMGSQQVRAAEPISVTGEIIHQIQAQVSQLNRTGGLPAHNLHPGDSVHITGGPMRGLHAIFLGPLTPAERVQVLLRFLGREQEVSVGVDDIEAVAPPIKRLRRTRGQGRRIRGA